jgi:hypothetical protein
LLSKVFAKLILYHNNIFNVEKKKALISLVVIALALIVVTSTLTSIKIYAQKSSDNGVRITIDTPSSKTSQIVQPVTVRKDSSGDIHIIGEIINKGPQTARFMEIIGTIYNTQNQTIGKQNAFTEPKDIEAGQSAPFELIIGSANNVSVDEVDRVKLHIDWLEPR